MAEYNEMVTFTCDSGTTLKLKRFAPPWPGGDHKIDGGEVEAHGRGPID